MESWFIGIAVGIGYLVGCLVGVHFGRRRGFTASAQACFDCGAGMRKACYSVEEDTALSTCSITMFGVEFKFNTQTATRTVTGDDDE